MLRFVHSTALKRLIPIVLALLFHNLKAQFPLDDYRFLEGITQVSAWKYSLNMTTGRVDDSCLYARQKFNKGELSEYIRYLEGDSSQYDKEIYVLDTAKKERRTIYESTKASRGCYFGRSYHPKKLIEVANDLGQLTKRTEYSFDPKEDNIEATYEYSADHRLQCIRVHYGKTLNHYYKIRYSTMSNTKDD